jgi:uncharacterized integral membrane protein
MTLGVAWPRSRLAAMSAGWPDASGSSAGAGGNPARGNPLGAPGPTESRRAAKAILAALVLMLLVVFVIRNSQRVSVDFILTKGHFRLIWVIVICSILGGIVGYLLGRPVRGRRGRRQRAGGSSGGSGDGDLPRL